jgi:head-tail adaptor
MKAFEGQSAFAGAGEFRQFITIQSPVLNAGGDEVASWAVFAQTWASVDPAIRNRVVVLFQAERLISLHDVVVRFRFIPGLDTTMRVLHGSVLYDIRDVADIASLGREIHLNCRIAPVAAL